MTEAKTIQDGVTLKSPITNGWGTRIKGSLIMKMRQNIYIHKIAIHAVTIAK